MLSQGIHTVRPLRAVALVATALLALIGVLVTASPAAAHDELLGSDPAADSTVDALPAELTLTFSGVIGAEDGASEVQVTDAEGTTLTDGTPTAQDNVLTQPLAAEGLGGEASGPITVLWKVVSSDGHPISGEFSFTVARDPSPDPTATSEPAPAPTATAEPSPTATPEATPSTAPVPDEGSNVLPWVIVGVVAVAVLGAVTYLLVSRSRRERALAEGPADGVQPGSEPPADR
ncbi:copper resistance protein CopC [Microbacterium sp. HD4P20]|uniref:copper resistance CopC family protein n=1 Tax=Microbacterium sp. HD4P20 TaxID=2864874 RepID=UPI0020A2BB29|nr:copper resistance protein CopC [Microbacterium sp. HD4P20]MCP2637157.1 copper resistance protein CopC [Microbacterium sp. HD4P20]